MAAIEDFVDLVERLGSSGISRGENDLSARLARCFEEVGLYTAIDTSSGHDNRRRPDIVGYVDEGTSDLSGFGEIVVESKKPREIPGSLIDALLTTDLWDNKFVPYVKAHLPSIRYFLLTTFERHLYVEITAELREIFRRGDPTPTECSDLVSSNAVNFDLNSQKVSWIGWIRTTLSPLNLCPPTFSEALDIFEISTSEELDNFADHLATLVAGETGNAESNFALINSVRVEVSTLADLPADIAASLSIYVLAQHPGMSVEAGQAYLAENLEAEINNFVSASIQSLIGRLFAFKMIEDCFCIGVQPPLLAEERYIFHHSRYDGLSQQDVVGQFFEAVRVLEAASSPAISNLSKTGRFYDWIENRVNPNAFVRVFRAFAAQNFSALSGDLLGRFFEHYAQRVDRRRRRQLGQYYTPPTIVQFIWAEALAIARSRNALDEIRVLDPGVGSATFLTEGARRMSGAGIHEFWKRLVGFDIDPQVIGVAYVNLFLAVLSQLQRKDADAVEYLHLYPTDSLEPTSTAPLNAYLPLLTAEPLRQYLAGQINLSANVKAARAYDIVIGNPPYKNNSNRTLQQVAETFPRLLQTSRANARLRERNIRDDYAWFFAAADYYIQEEGLIGFVVSSSFCGAEGYRYFRRDLLANYSIRRLIHLGADIFEDVGPRTSFVVVLLERRSAPVEIQDITAHEFYDLRTIQEPEERLALLAEAAEGDWSNWPTYQEVSPTEQTGFRLLPTARLVPTIKSVGHPLFASGKESSIFLKKWPGFITALDGLWKASSQVELRDRIQRFFECAHDQSANRAQRINQFLAAENLTELDAERVSVFLQEAQQSGLQFDRDKIKRVITGSSPNEARWYPSSNLTSWVYYEPSFRVPRNVNEGRPVGYGTMTQWGEPAAHETYPKLIFTTATSSRNGLKAFVVRDEWFVKLHGGTRQQFNYTVCENPVKGSQLDGRPNNLSPPASEFLERMRNEGWDEESFLLYLAAFYNTDIANEFLDGGGGKVLHIPFTEPQVATEIADIARSLRSLAVAESIFQTTEQVNSTDIAYDLSILLEQNLIDVAEASGGRFQSTRHFRSRPETLDEIGSLKLDLESQLNALVRVAIGLSD